MIRSQFPFLNHEINGHTPVYFDNAATAQKPISVINRVSQFYQSSNANIHRGVHTLSAKASAMYEDTRIKVAKFIHAPCPRRDVDNIIFTSGTTAAVNLLTQVLGETFSVGDEIILSVTEHHSNLIPWQMLAKRKGLKLKFVSILDDGSLDYEMYESLFTSKTKFVAISMMSNVLGIVNDSKFLVEIAHRHGALIFLDAAQFIAHQEVNVEKLDCDFLAFSAHKIYGPTGVGVLYGKSNLLKNLSPTLGGGGMISRVTLEDFSVASVPARFEPGTPNIAGVIGFGSALEFINGVGYRTIEKTESTLTKYALAEMARIPELTIYGLHPEKTSVICFNMDGVHPHDLTQFLDQFGVAARSGHHCAQPLMGVLKQNATCRISFGIYNTEAEIDIFIQALLECKSYFGI